MVGVHGPADELVLVEDADLGDVPRVVADNDGFADIGGQQRRDVSESLEVHAVAVDDPGFGHGQQQQVQFVHGCRKPGQPAVTYPGMVRGGFDFRMLALVVVLRDETADGRVQLFEGQHRCRRRVAAASGVRAVR